MQDILSFSENGRKITPKLPRKIEKRHRICYIIYTIFGKENESADVTLHINSGMVGRSYELFQYHYSGV